MAALMQESRTRPLTACASTGSMPPYLEATRNARLRMDACPHGRASMMSLASVSSPLSRALSSWMSANAAGLSPARLAAIVGSSFMSACYASGVPEPLSQPLAAGTVSDPADGGKPAEGALERPTGADAVYQL